MPTQWIDKLNESNSRIHKEKVIEQALIAHNLGSKEAGIFLLCAKKAYDPFKTYNTTQVPLLDDSHQPVINDIYVVENNVWVRFFKLLDELDNRLMTGHAAIGAIEHVSKMFTANDWNKLARSVILKDLKVGATAKTFNKIVKKTEFEIPTFECQLAQDSKKHKKKLVGPKILQPKLDGVRALAIVTNHGVNIFSRNGKPLHNFTLIEQQLNDAIFKTKLSDFCYSDSRLKEPLVFDGEIMSDDFQTLMKQAQRKTNVDTSDCVYNIFDVLTYTEFKNGKSNTVQEERVRQLTDFNKALTNEVDSYKLPYDALHIIDEDKSIVVNLDSEDSFDVMTQYAEQCIADGYEGIMIKDKFAEYECKRSVSWLKWKPVITVDLTIVDVEEGTGRNEGRLGALVCEGVDDGRDIRVNVGSGFSDSNRDDYWDNRSNLVGQVVEVKADVVTQNQDGTYSLRFPRFERFRSFNDGEKV